MPRKQHGPSGASGEGWHAYAPGPTNARGPVAARGADLARPATLNVLTVRTKGRLSIDGRRLEDLVTEAERQTGERSPGDFTWLPAPLVRAPSRHLLGEPHADHEWGDDWERYGFEEGSVALGGCRCGAVGCHPLVVVMETGNGLVRWRRFQTRASDDLGLGPFVFDERTYRLALGHDR